MSGSPKIVATIEARLGSTRLPEKVLLRTVGNPMLEPMIERLLRVPSLDDIVIAMTTHAADQPIVDLTGRLEMGGHRGSETDVTAHPLGAADELDIGVVVNTTGA